MCPVASLSFKASRYVLIFLQVYCCRNSVKHPDLSCEFLHRTIQTSERADTFISIVWTGKTLSKLFLMARNEQV